MSNDGDYPSSEPVPAPFSDDIVEGLLEYRRRCQASCIYMRILI